MSAGDPKERYRRCANTASREPFVLGDAPSRDVVRYPISGCKRSARMQGSLLQCNQLVQFNVLIEYSGRTGVLAADGSLRDRLMDGVPAMRLGNAFYFRSSYI